MPEAFCEADLNYARARPSVHEGPVAIPTKIYDGRQFDNPGWEVCGFELQAHRSAVTDWSSDQQIADIHYGEISALAKRLTGCRHALVSGHILRNPEQVKIHPDLGPIAFVHSDFAETYGDRIRRYYSHPEELTEQNRIVLEKAGITPREVSAADRLMTIQFWRNVGPEKMDLPIAFCDARSVTRNEMRSFPVNNYAGGGFDFDAFAVIQPTAHLHKWYTYPEPRIDEVVVLRTFDSQRVARSEPFWTPHSAFRDPEVASGEPSRYSIELRATCLF